MNEAALNGTTVCVLFGGVSTEYQISLRSAYNVIDSLRKAGFQVVRVGIRPDGRWLLFSGSDSRINDGSWENDADLRGDHTFSFCKEKAGGSSVRDFIEQTAGCVPDVIFPVIHGINCEDGTVQGLLELSGIPYVGCNVASSALGMDKMLSRRIFRSAGIPVCKCISASRSRISKDLEGLKKEIARKLGYPCFLKPNNGGSSVGTCRVDSPDQLGGALNDVSRFDDVTLIEEWIPAREIEIAVMGNDDPLLSVPGEILTAAGVEYYDYKTKYIDADSASVRIPAQLTSDEAGRIRRYAMKAYKLLGCSGMARVDFFIDTRSGRIILNEINTIPGFTSISLYPKAWEVSGVSGESLVTMLCRYALQYKESRVRMETI